ncbi:Ig-like domain-containing protein [Alcanivorax sp. S71-1-4]|uniref:Ig-like domain-containing protein n=1 Tax=Alcanivorax sp. S71-1-4 TaxID=1177159 RepID=UPI00135C6F36|nr:Ig-like domain-containing protein [Alcanivorax sp. S71-1-4]
MKRIIMAACIVSLAACGGDKDDVATEQQQDWESRKQSLVYSFPDDNQQQVPVPSPVVLRFSSPVMETSPGIVLREVGGPIVSDFDMEWVDGKRGLIITPNKKLKPRTEYLVQVPEIALEKGASPARSLRFTTRGLYEGPKSQVAEDAFEISRMIPDGENYQVLDFSSFRVQFSQPLERSSVKYGEGANDSVQLIGPQGLVDAHLLVSGNYMTIDPVEDLTPGAEYSLNMTSAVTSIYGDSLPGGGFGNPGGELAVSIKVTPQDSTSPTTGERVAMVQDVADTGELSPLTGMPINLVPMASLLLGEETATQASGIVAAELAFVPNFPDATPFRVKRGSLIEGASIEVLINGAVPAGFDSGKVRMDFISDASGYLLPNPYSNADDAPRQVRLFMDVSVSTEAPQANGAITQDLLHIELVGTSIVEDGRMVINAVGVVEPDVLGSERAAGILSFYMKAFEDQDNPPTTVADNMPPVVQSWIPGDNVTGFRTTDPVIVQFDEPIDSKSALDLILLEENGVAVEASIVAKGSSVIIKPKNSFKASVQESINSVASYVYTLTLKQGIRDLSGNATSSDTVYQFELPAIVTTADEFERSRANIPPIEEYRGEVGVVVRSPMLTTVYPGFPCVIDTSSIDLSQGFTGRCQGYLSEEYRRGETPDGNSIFSTPHKLPDDVLPLPELPGNRPIVAIFTKNIDPQSVSLGGSFQVHRVDASGAAQGNVEGNISVDGNKITFYPSEPWVEGEYYSYTLGSNGDRHSPSASCDGTSSICDESGLPIQTQLHELSVQTPFTMDIVFQDPNSPDGGGMPLTQYFVATDESNEVLQILKAPSSDTNANMVHDSNKDVDYQADYYFLRNAYLKYTVEEEGAENQPLDPNGCAVGDVGCVDPDGVLPPANSAKLFGGGEFTFGPYMVPMVSIGCAFENGISSMPPYQKSVCPESKFTYLTSDLVTEIGEFNQTLGGVEVKIWPGQIMSTAVLIHAPMLACNGGNCVLGLDSGPQVMRMRYAKDDPLCVEDVLSGSTCPRSKPITALIKDVNGEPHISTEVEVYVDAIDLQQRVTLIGEALMGVPGISSTHHDMVSVPITLELEGKVEFNDDGTMKISMLNSNDIEFSFGLKLYAAMFNLEAPLAYTSIKIPSEGSRVDYFSEIIK